MNPQRKKMKRLISGVFYPLIKTTRSSTTLIIVDTPNSDTKKFSISELRNHGSVGPR